MKKSLCLKVPVYAALAALSVSCATDPASMPFFDEAAWLEEVLATDIELFFAPHYNEGKKEFFNPWMPRDERPKQDGPRRNFFSRRNKPEFPPWPEESYAAVKNDYSYLKDPSFDSISFAGHASFIVKINGQTVFTDPFFSKSAVIVSKDVYIEFDYSKVPDKPVVLISHNHYDHLDKSSIKALIKKNAVFLVPLKMKSLLAGWGAKEVYELDWWQSIKLNGINYTFLPAQHWSMRVGTGQGSGKTLWGGWLIEGNKTIYYSGDTGYFRGFELYGLSYEIDYALITAGSYEPRWFMHYQHQSPEEMLRAADDLKTKIAIPFHFGSISLSYEPLNYPLYELDNLIKTDQQYAERIKLLRVGEKLDL